MKYNMTARIYAIAFTKMIKDFYKKNFPEINIDVMMKDVNREYREMVLRTPGIGGSKNSLEANLTGACFFFAMAKKMPGMTPELMNLLIDAGMQSDLMEKAHRGKRKKGVLFSDKTLDRKAAEGVRSQTEDYEMGWKFTLEKGEDEFFCTYTKCGICRLAEKEHVERFLPCMCRMDYGTYGLLGGELIRNKTLAGGDECCDFHVVKRK